MTMTGVLGIPMDRMGSGTTWLPDAVSLPSKHSMLGRWSLMLHGFVFAEYDHQSGPRGDDQWGVINWGMLMASREVAGGQLQLRTMLSLDPATVTSRGYPLLGQTGETYKGRPLHDRQHPHDFFKELGLLYERPILHGRRLGGGGQWATAIVWGLNASHGATQAIQLESELILDGRNTMLLRVDRREDGARTDALYRGRQFRSGIRL